MEDLKQEEITENNTSKIDMAGFKNPIGLTKWVKGLLIAGVIMSAVSVYSGWLQYGFLQDVANGFYYSEEQANADAVANDAREGIIGLSSGVVFITGLIVFLMWVYRANYNARKLSGEEMEFSPGWSVGWYFIPILSLWKPYQCMKEIWRVSSGVNQSGDFIIGAWWLLWVVSGLLSKASLKLSLKAERLDELISSTNISMVSDSIDVLTGVATLVLVSKVFTMQMSRFNGEIDPSISLRAS